jgi:hypothetical protein
MTIKKIAASCCKQQLQREIENISARTRARQETQNKDILRHFTKHLSLSSDALRKGFHSSFSIASAIQKEGIVLPI